MPFRRSLPFSIHHLVPVTVARRALVGSDLHRADGVILVELIIVKDLDVKRRSPDLVVGKSEGEGLVVDRIQRLLFHRGLLFVAFLTVGD